MDIDYCEIETSKNISPQSYHDQFQQSISALSQYFREQKDVPFNYQYKIDKLWNECQFFIKGFKSLLQENHQLKDQLIEFSVKVEMTRQFLSDMVQEEDAITHENRHLSKILVPIDGMLDYIGKDYDNFRLIIEELNKAEAVYEQKFQNLCDVHKLEIQQKVQEIADIEKQNRLIRVREQQRLEEEREQFRLIQEQYLKQQTQITDYENKLKRLEDELSITSSRMVALKRKEAANDAKLEDMERQQDRAISDILRKNKEQLQFQKQQHLQYMKTLVVQCEEKLQLQMDQLNQLTISLEQMKFNYQESLACIERKDAEIILIQKQSQKKINEQQILIQQHEKSIQLVVERCERYDRERKEAINKRDELQLLYNSLFEEHTEEKKKVDAIRTQMSILDNSYKMKIQVLKQKIERLTQQHNNTVNKLVEDHQLQITLRLSNLSNDFERKMQLTDTKRMNEVVQLTDRIKNQELQYNNTLQELQSKNNLLELTMKDLIQDHSELMLKTITDYSTQLSEKHAILTKTEQANLGLRAQMNQSQQKYEEDKAEIIKRYTDIIRGNQLDQEELARKEKKPLEAFIEGLERDNQMLQKLNHKYANDLEGIQENNNLKEAKHREEVLLLNEENTELNKLLEARVKAMTSKCNDLMKSVQMLNDLKNRLLEEFKQRDYLVSLNNNEIINLREAAHKQKSDFQKEQAEKESKHKQIRAMMDLEINRLQEEYRIILMKSQMHEKDFLHLKKENNEWGPETFSKRIALEKNQMKKQSTEMIESFAKQIQSHTEMREKTLGELRDCQSKIKELQDQISVQEGVWKKRLDELLGSKDLEMKNMKDTLESELKMNAENLRQVNEDMEQRVKKNSREEVSKIQIKYEQMLDQLKAKIQTLKDGNLDNLDDKEQELMKKVMQMSDEVEAQNQSHEQTKKILTVEREKFNQYINELNQKFAIIFDKQQEEVNQYRISKEIIRETNRTLASQIDLINTEKFNKEQTIINLYERKIQSSVRELQEQNEELSYEVGSVKGHLKRTEDNLQDQIIDLIKRIDERPSRQEDIEQIQQLIQQIQVLNQQISEANQNVKDSNQKVVQAKNELRDAKKQKYKIKPQPVIINKEKNPIQIQDNIKINVISTPLNSIRQVKTKQSKHSLIEMQSEKNSEKNTQQHQIDQSVKDQFDQFQSIKSEEQNQSVMYDEVNIKESRISNTQEVPQNQSHSKQIVERQNNLQQIKDQQIIRELSQLQEERGQSESSFQNKQQPLNIEIKHRSRSLSKTTEQMFENNATIQNLTQEEDKSYFNVEHKQINGLNVFLGETNTPSNQIQDVSTRMSRTQQNIDANQKAKTIYNTKKNQKYQLVVSYSQMNDSNAARQEERITDQTEMNQSFQAIQQVDLSSKGQSLIKQRKKPLRNEQFTPYYLRNPTKQRPCTQSPQKDNRDFRISGISFQI